MAPLRRCYSHSSCFVCLVGRIKLFFSHIQLGNTLSNDHLYANKFDYMLSNPPFGVDWKKIEGDIAEVQPHVADAWIDASKRDPKDGEIGIVGYEIPFNRHFYKYQPPRPLAEIDADLDAVSAEIMALLREVHS